MLIGLRWEASRCNDKLVLIMCPSNGLHRYSPWWVQQESSRSSLYCRVFAIPIRHPGSKNPYDARSETKNLKAKAIEFMLYLVCSWTSNTYHTVAFRTNFGVLDLPAQKAAPRYGVHSEYIVRIVVNITQLRGQTTSFIAVDITLVILIHSGKFC